MGLLDDYSKYSGEDVEEAEDISDPAVLRRKRAELERNIVMTEADLKKTLREKQALEVEQRKLKKEDERIRVERDALDKKLKKIEDDERYQTEEIKGLKKKLKLLISRS
jgi:SpoVK/Ycf46/Vps4 family AAA+-type ATPase